MANVKINDLTQATPADNMQLETDQGGQTSSKITLSDLKGYIGSTTAAAGNNGDVQYNSGGNRAASDNFYYNAAAATLSITPVADNTGTDALNVYGEIDMYNPNASQGAVGSASLNGPSISTSRGTGPAPAINNANDLIGGSQWFAYSGSTPGYNAHVASVGRVTGSTANNLGGQWELYTKADNGALVLRLTVDNAGGATFANLASGMLKSVSGKLTPAVAGTDYQAAGNYATGGGTATGTNTGDQTVPVTIAASAGQALGSYNSSTGQFTRVGVTNTTTDQTPAGTGYGTLGGTLDGSNKTFTVSKGSYTTGSLRVFLNGQRQSIGSSADFLEATPASGTFTMNTAPQSTDIMVVDYAY